MNILNIFKKKPTQTKPLTKVAPSTATESLEQSIYKRYVVGESINDIAEHFTITTDHALEVIREIESRR